MNGVLVDISVCADHFCNRNEGLVSLLTLDLVLSHPLIVTELACGTPPAPRSCWRRPVECATRSGRRTEEELATS